MNWRKEQRTKTLWFLDKVTFIAKLFIYFEVKVAQLCPSLLDPMDYSLQPPLSMEILQAILIPACVSSSPAFLMMYSAYKLNKQGDNIQP